MIKIVVIFFAVLLAVFCLVCVLAPLSARSAHMEDEVVDAVVVKTYHHFSLVKVEGGDIYYLPENLPIGTKIKVKISKTLSYKPRSYFHTAKYVIAEESEIVARVICRLSETVLLCLYEDREIFVECTDEEQAELTQKVEIPAYSYESLGVTYTETEDILVVPICRAEIEWIFPECYKEA